MAFQSDAEAPIQIEFASGEMQNQLGQPMNSMNFDDILSSFLPEEEDHLDNKRNLQDSLQKGNDEIKMQMNSGEMTLEDFLLKAGVMVKESGKGASNVSSSGSSDHVVGSSCFLSGGDLQWPRINNIQSGPQLIYSSPAVGMISDLQKSVGFKRESSSELSEEIVQRRQTRMIKNRESAARSRARKQAYTHELEEKVSRLEEENRILKKQKEFDEMIAQNVANPEPKIGLRRTSSAHF